MVKHSTSSTRKRWLFRLLYYPLSAVLVLSLAEGEARLLGHRPWVITKPDIVVEPGGRLYSTHPSLGYAPLPGKYRVTLGGSYKFTLTNLDNTLRVTHPLEASSGKSKAAIWIFGDSITYGWSVNDEDTYAWLLQAKMPDYEIVNFGVNGYGTLQSLIQLREALKQGNAPKVVVLAYASWHDVRNTFTRGRRKMLLQSANLGPTNQPYALLDKSGKVDVFFDSLQYREFPLMRYSAFIHALEEAYDKYQERHSQSHEITKAIVKEFAGLCRAQGIEFVVAGLTTDPTTADMLSYSRSLGAKAVDMWVDFQSIKENNNQPYDSHPSAIAHRQYAQILEDFLRRDVLNDHPGQLTTIRPENKNK